ncbi:MAG: Ycf66 family protein [Prochlorococcus sp.]
MVNASLNWASICGVTIAIWSLLVFPASIAQIIFLLQRRADYSTRLIISTAWRRIIAIALSIGGLLVGGILFFQGWRLDPILQFGMFLLTAGVIAESANKYKK